MYAQITIVGNLGKDPEFKKLDNGAITARFSVASNKKFTSSGVTKQTTTWFPVEAYQPKESGIVTGLIQPHLRKGQHVLIVGEPTIEEWTDKAGVKQRTFRIKLGPQSTLKLLGGDRNHGESAPSVPARTASAARAAPADVSDEDIPF